MRIQYESIQKKNANFKRFFLFAKCDILHCISIQTLPFSLPFLINLIHYITSINKSSQLFQEKYGKIHQYLAFGQGS